MINRIKVVDDIQNDGKYDAILDVVKKATNNLSPTKEEIAKLVESDPFYIKEYKDLNRWGELSSVHINELEINEDDNQEAKTIKETINKNATYLKHGEEYETKQKNIIYLAWTGFIALPSIYVIDNIVRLATDLYTTNESHVYISFAIVVLLSIWGFMKVKSNHARQHNRYIQTQIDTRALIEKGLENESFSFEEVYLH
jgi:hypothetical protein